MMEILWIEAWGPVFLLRTTQKKHWIENVHLELLDELIHLDNLD